jgi:hypothetical protein
LEKVVGRKRLWTNLGTIPAFTWRDWRKVRPTSSQKIQNHSQDSNKPSPEYKSEVYLFNTTCPVEGTEPRESTWVFIHLSTNITNEHEMGTHKPVHSFALPKLRKNKGISVQGACSNLHSFGLSFSQLWLWGVLSSGIQCCVVWWK